MRLRINVGTVQIMHRENAEEVVHPHVVEVAADLVVTEATEETVVVSPIVSRLPEVLDDLRGVVLMSWNDADLEYVMLHLNDTFAFIHTLEDVSLGGLARLLHKRIDHLTTGLSAGRIRCASLTLQQDHELSIAHEEESHAHMH